MLTSGNRVIVADDHPLIAVALRLSIQAVDPDIDVVEVGTFAALKRVISSDTRLVLLDLLMPDVEGLSALRFLRARHPPVPVAVVSGVRERVWLRAAEALGAIAFVPKTLDAQSLQGVLQRLLEGGAWWPPCSPEAPDVGEGSGPHERLERLTQQELRILLHIKNGRLNKQIAGDLGISESTVKTHISNLLLKLDLRSRTQAAVLAQRLLAWKPEPAPEASAGSVRAE